MSERAKAIHDILQKYDTEVLTVAVLCAAMEEAYEAGRKAGIQELWSWDKEGGAE